MTTLFSSLTENDKRTSVEHLVADSTPRDEFFLMILLAVCMATFGLLIGDASVIIGSMLIAPLLSPVLGISMGVVMADRALIRRSTLTVARSVALSLAVAAGIVLLFGAVIGMSDELNPEIIGRLSPDIAYVAIALIAGTAASYAVIRPNLSAALPGVVVSASLIPPLAVSGIGIARLDWHMATSAFVLFLVNVACIVFAASVVFSLMRLYTTQPVAHRAMEHEDKRLRKDHDAALKDAAK